MNENEMRSRILQLNTTRMTAHDAMKALADEAKGKAFTAEQDAAWARMEADIVDTDAERNRLITLETREREAGEIRERNLSAHGEVAVTGQERKFADQLRSFLSGEGGKEMVFADVSPGYRQRTYENQGMSRTEARALAWDTGSIASGVPTTTASSLYQLMEASIAMFALPTFKFNTSSGEQWKLPRVNAHGIGTQVSGQGTLLAGTDPTFLAMTLDAFKYGELVIVANEVLTDTGFDIVGFVTSNIARALSRVIDIDLVTGSGSGKPQGITTSVLVGSNGTAVTGGSLIVGYEGLVDLVYSVNDSYRSSGNAAWLMRDSTAGIVRKIRDGSGGTIGAAMWQPSQTVGIAGGRPDTLLGYPVYTDPNMASSASNAKIAVFGDWSSYWIRTVGPVTIESDSSRYFDTDQTGFRGKWRVDGDCIDLTALNILKQSV